MVYELYLTIVNNMNNNNYPEMETAFEAYLDEATAFTDAQSSEWQRVVEEKIGLETALCNLYNANYIIYTVQLMKTYVQTPTIRTAYKFVKAYDTCIELGLSIDLTSSDITSVYQTAKTTNMPSDNAALVYEAYVQVVEAIESGDRDEIDDAVSAFNAVVDVYNSLTMDEFDAVAILLDLNSEDPELTAGEYIAQIIFADWVDINILDSFDKVYSDFTDEPIPENAEALIEFYDMALGEDEVISKSLVMYFFPDIDDVYAEAKTLLENDIDLPAGDSIHFAYILIVLATSGIVMTLSLNKRKLVHL